MSVAGRIGRVGAFRARTAGALARREGKPVTDCPYSPAGDWNERVKARYWVLGWTRADSVLRGYGL